jgi:hypothetical protein
MSRENSLLVVPWPASQYSQGSADSLSYQVSSLANAFLESQFSVIPLMPLELLRLLLVVSLDQRMMLQRILQ